MNRLLKIGGAIALVLFVGYFIFAQVNQHSKFKDQLEEIQSVRLAMEDSVRVLKERTRMRDLELRDLIRRDMELLDTLNVTLAKLNKSSRVIEQKIEENKEIIDRLWKTDN
jgi:E3 ubiquitin-protein ligase DOA10